MDRFRFSLALDVEVEAFDSEDAESVIRDFFGLGPMDDILEVMSLKIKQR